MFKVPENFRLTEGQMKSSNLDGNNGVFLVSNNSIRFVVIAADQGGWEHVSVSLADRCPTWEEMCHIKELFWGDSDTVVQFHPSKDEYVNNHPFCLHLWRNVMMPVELPPSFMVGIKGSG